MIHAGFSRLPWLLFERQVLELTAYAHNTLDKLVDCGLLVEVKPAGCQHRRFQKIQVALLLKISVEPELAQLRKEPWLLSEKAMLQYTGYSPKTFRQIVAAGGLHRLRPAGLTNNRYRKSELVELVGVSHLV